MTFRHLRKDISRRGSMALEVLGVLVVMGMFIAFAAAQGEQTADTSRATALAHQLNLTSKGAQNYLDANAATLLKELENRDHVVVTMDDVTAGDGSNLNIEGDAAEGLRRFMPVNFQHTTFGQDVKMYVFKGPDGAVHALFGTSGGKAEDTKDTQGHEKYMSAARAASGMNGFGMRLDTKAAGGSYSTGHTIAGTKGSWEFEFDDEEYGNIPEESFAVGQLVRPLYSFSAAVKDDMMYRVAIEGHPELNAFQTDLHMNGYQITDSGTITISQHPQIAGADGELADVPPGGNGLVIEPFDTDGPIAQSAQMVCDGYGGPAKPDGFIFTVKNPDANGQTEDDLNGVWICMNGDARLLSDSLNSTSVKSVESAKNGDTVKKPSCAEGTVPSISLSLTAFAERTEKPASITAVQPYAEDLGDSWRVRVRIKTTRHKAGGVGTEDAWTEPPSTGPDSKLNFLNVQTSCLRKGVIAASK